MRQCMQCHQAVEQESILFAFECQPEAHEKIPGLFKLTWLLCFFAAACINPLRLNLSLCGTYIEYTYIEYHSKKSTAIDQGIGWFAALLLMKRHATGVGFTDPIKTLDAQHSLMQHVACVASRKPFGNCLLQRSKDTCPRLPYIIPLFSCLTDACLVTWILEKRLNVATKLLVVSLFSHEVLQQASLQGDFVTLQFESHSEWTCTLCCAVAGLGHVCAIYTVFLLRRGHCCMAFNGLDHLRLHVSWTSSYVGLSSSRLRRRLRWRWRWSLSPTSNS